MADELGEILFNLLDTPIRTERYRITGELIYGSYEEQRKRKIDQSTSEIKSLFKEKLPKKKLLERGTTEYYANSKYNELLTEIEKIMEVL